MKRMVRGCMVNYLIIEIPRIRRRTNSSLEVQGGFGYAGGEIAKLRTLENFSTAHSVNWSNVSTT